MSRWLLFAALALTTHAARCADATVATYTANYRVEYKGRDAGTSEWSVRRVGDQGVYELTMSITPKGLLKLVRPKPTVERSQFRLEANIVQPLEYWYEDGSRSGEGNLHIVFDWERRVATVSNAAARHELAVPAAALDRGSLKAALMRDLAVAGQPGRYELADEDSLGTYEYTDGGATTLTTEVGSLDTRIFVQRRIGSSRATWLWMAPGLRFLPVRIEQRRDGEVQTTLMLVSVEGLAPSH